MPGFQGAFHDIDAIGQLFFEPRDTGGSVLADLHVRDRGEHNRDEDGYQRHP